MNTEANPNYSYIILGLPFLGAIEKPFHNPSRYQHFPLSLHLVYFKTMSSKQVLVEKIERFIRKFYLNRLVQGVLVGAALWIVFYLLVNALEYFSWFSSKVRLGLFVLLLLGSAVVLVHWFLVPLWNLVRFRKRMTHEQAALLIGRFFPDIQDKLLNTLQLADAAETDPENALLAASIEQRTQRLTPVRFTDAVDLRGNLRYLWIFLGLVAVLIGLVCLNVSPNILWVFTE